MGLSLSPSARTILGRVCVCVCVCESIAVMQATHSALLTAPSAAVLPSSRRHRLNLKVSLSPSSFSLSLSVRLSCSPLSVLPSLSFSRPSSARALSFSAGDDDDDAMCVERERELFRGSFTIRIFPPSRGFPRLLLLAESRQPVVGGSG